MEDLREVMFVLDVSVELMANVVDRPLTTPRIEDRMDDGIIRIIVLYFTNYQFNELPLIYNKSTICSTK